MCNRSSLFRAAERALSRHLPPERPPEAYRPLARPEWADVSKFYRFILEINRPV